MGADVVRRPEVFDRNLSLPAGVFDLIESLPSISTPNRLANPLRRARNLVKLLADDSTGKALVSDAGALLTKTLNARLDGLAAEHAETVASNVADILTADIKTAKIGTTGQETVTGSRSGETHSQDVDRATRRIINSLKEGAGKDYYTYRVGKAGDAADTLQIRTELAAMLMIEGLVDEVAATATKFVQDQLVTHAVAIKNTTGATRDAYRQVQEQTSESEVVTVELRANEKAPTLDMKGKPLPTFRGHIFSDSEGQFPAQLNDWEKTIIQTEIDRSSFVAWYRNPSRATPNALRIAYQNDAGKWASLQVDFIVISRRDDRTLAASIIDPHGDHLADARAKLHALADFAERYRDTFVRIESIAKVSNDTLRVLELRSKKVRDAVRSFSGGKVTALYESGSAVDYQ